MLYMIYFVVAVSRMVEGCRQKKRLLQRYTHHDTLGRCFCDTYDAMIPLCVYSASLLRWCFAG